MYRIVIYLFPLVLLLFEFGLRSLIDVNSFQFTGPTIAAAGLSFLPALIKPKTVPNTPKMQNAVVVKKGDQNFIPFVWIFMLIFLFGWCYSCVLSIQNPDKIFIYYPAHLETGILMYVVGVIFSLIKEVL